MDETMKAYCGTYCGICEWKEKTGCKGCQVNGGSMFWGECDKAKCCIEKKLEHCGQCPELPCQKLKELFENPEHGDKGTRLSNLLNWKNGKDVYKKLGNLSQEKAKEL